MTNRHRYTLAKTERLSWKRYIDFLFKEGQSFTVTPLRVVYLWVEKIPASVAFIVSVPKRNIKKAVRRNRIKRQVREAYRLRKYALTNAPTERNQSLLLAFLYVDKEIQPFADIEKAMAAVVQTLQDK